jgi:hypothetical protein
MNRLLLIATALLALTSVAGAVEMPKELHGVWCLDRTTGYYIPSEECTVRAGFGISASGFPIPDDGECTVLKVKQIGKRAWRIKVRCEADNAKPLIVDYIWQINKDSLKVRIVGLR